MAISRTLKLGLLADVSRYGMGLDKASRETKGFTGNVSKYAARAAASFAAIGAAAGAAAIHIGIDSVKAAMDDEKASSQLAVTLRNVAKATDKTVASTEKWITKQQFAAGISDNDLRKGLQRLVRSTKDVTEAQKLGELAASISVSTGKDYVTVANALAKANDGQFNALKKLGITMGDNATNAAALATENKKLLKLQDDLTYAQENYGTGSEEYKKALGKVEEQQLKVNEAQKAGVDWVGELATEFGGAIAANADTLAGKTKILNERFGEMKETIGAKLIPYLSNLATALTQVVAGFSGQKGIDRGVNVASDALSAARDEKYQDSWYTVGDSLRAAADAFSNLYKAISGNKQSVDAISTITGALNNMADAINKVADAWDNPIFKAGRKLTKGLVSPSSLLPNFGGGRATGGTVRAGGVYRVGEFGPETLVMNGASGSIRHASNGGGNTFIFNGVINGESARRSIEQLLQDSSRRTGAVNFAGGTL